MVPGVILLTFPFVHPALAGAGLALASIPVLIHLLNRRRYVRVPWAAMTFLLAARKKSAVRMRLEQWLLLLVRAALIALLGFAVARPFVPVSAVIPLASSRCHRILVLDNSLSMNARDETGRSRFDEAKARAEVLVASFDTSDAISLVTLASPAEAVIAQATFDRRTIRERLAAVEPTQRSTDVTGALEKTVEIIKASNAAPGNQFVVLISDMQRSLWVSESPGSVSAGVVALRNVSSALPNSEDHLTVIRTGAAVPQNVAVTALATDATLHGVGVPIPIVARVAGFGQTTLRGAALEVRRQGRIIRREQLPPIVPGAPVLAAFTLEFGEEGSQAVEARLANIEGDVLSEDNTRFVSVEVRKSTRILLVDGRPSGGRLTNDTGFLGTALKPQADDRLPDVSDSSQGRDEKRKLIEPKIIGVADLEGEVLPDFAVVALCNVAALSARQWEYVSRFVSDGGGLLVFAGDQLNPDNYNRFGRAEGSGLIPGTIGRPTDAVPTAGTSEGTSSDPQVGFKPESFTHPMLAEFAGHPNSGLFIARVHRYLPLTPDPRADVLLRYTNDQPALVSTTWGLGRVVFVTTTANMDWSNLPAKGDFIPLVLKAVGYLSPRRGDHRNLTVGQPIEEPVEAAQSSLPYSLVAGDGSRRELSLIPTGTALRLHHGPVDQAGVYSLTIGAEIRQFAVNCDPSESSLAAVEEEEFRAVVDRPLRFLADSPTLIAGSGARRTTELGRLAFYAVVILLLVDMVLAMTFNQQSAVGNRKSKDRSFDEIHRMAAQPR